MTAMVFRKNEPNEALWPWIGGAVVLAVVVACFAYLSFERGERHMARVLREKGASLIRSFEAGARTGMMGRFGANVRLQHLLEQTADQPDINFLAVTDLHGRVLAHNERDRIGTILYPEGGIEALAPSGDAWWFLAEDEHGRKSFVVYRFFRIDSSERGWHERFFRPPGDEQSEPDFGDMIIFVGLDVHPFEEAREADMRNTFLLSGLLFLSGAAVMAALFWSQRVRASRRQLSDSRTFASEVVGNLPEGLVIVGPEGRVTFANDAALELLGLESAEIVGRTPDEALPVAVAEVAWRLDAERVVLEGEAECLLRDERCVPLGVSGARIISEHEGERHDIGRILILRDLSEVRQLQEEVRRKEKLAAVGSLAAGVAHEIRNPLSSIKGYATYFGSKFPEGSPDAEAAEVMVREVDRLNRVITELLGLSRPSELRCSEVDVAELVARTVRLVRQDAEAAGVRVDERVEPGLTAVLDPDRVSQALLNIYLNALQAMPDGGVLSVSAAPRGEGRLTLRVADTGPGIAPDKLGKIFDPYFTTKNQGTGLGLAVVQKIVEAHGGEIRVVSEPGLGAAFEIILPADCGGAEGE